MTGADAWRVIRANWLLIALLLIASGVVGYGVNWYLAKNYSRWRASAILEVQARYSLSGAMPTAEREYMDPTCSRRRS